MRKYRFGLFQCWIIMIIMEDQLRKERRRKGQFQVIFELKKTEKETLTLQLLSHHSRSFYHLTVDEHYLLSNSDMASFFPSPSHLLFTLRELFDLLELSNDGIITLKVPLRAAKIDLTKVYQLQMEPWPEGELEWLRTRLKQHQEEEAQRIAQKNLQIQALKATIEEQQKHISRLQQDIILDQSTLGSLKQRICDLEASLEQANTQLLLSEQANTKAERQTEQLRASLDIGKSMLERMKADQKRATIFQEKVLSCLFEPNPQLYHFHYSYTLSGLKAVKKAENGWSTFAAGWPVLPGQSLSVSFKLTKMRDGSLAIGVGSQAVLGFIGLEHTEFIGYLCRDGRIYENGIKKLQGTPVLPDQALTMTVTRGVLQGTVRWQAGGVEIGSASLPNHFNGKNLLIMVKVFWKEDAFQMYF